MLLIYDGRCRRPSIRMLEELEVASGGLDGSGDSVKGNVTRGGRMLTEETYVSV